MKCKINQLMIWSDKWYAKLATRHTKLYVPAVNLYSKDNTKQISCIGDIIPLQEQLFIIKQFDDSAAYVYISDLFY